MNTKANKNQHFATHYDQIQQSHVYLTAINVKGTLPLSILRPMKGQLLHIQSSYFAVRTTKYVQLLVQLELFSWKTTSHKDHLEVFLPNSRLLSSLICIGMWSSMKITQCLFLRMDNFVPVIGILLACL